MERRIRFGALERRASLARLDFDLSKRRWSWHRICKVSASSGGNRAALKAGVSNKLEKRAENAAYSIDTGTSDQPCSLTAIAYGSRPTRFARINCARRLPCWG